MIKKAAMRQFFNAKRWINDARCHSVWCEMVKQMEHLLSFDILTNNCNAKMWFNILIFLLLIQWNNIDQILSWYFWRLKEDKALVLISSTITHPYYEMSSVGSVTKTSSNLKKYREEKLSTFKQ